MANPKVLIFIDWFSPGYKAGGPITSNRNIVDHLRDDFDIYLLTSDMDYNDDKPYESISPNCWGKHYGVNVCYLSRSHQNFSTIKRIVREIDCDVWYINGIYSRNFSMLPLFISSILSPRKVVVAARGMLSPHALCVKPMPKRVYLTIAKVLGLFRSVVFHAASVAERGHIESIFKNNEVLLIENLPKKGVSSSFITPKEGREVRLVSFARISSEKNTLYALQCLKYCKARVIYDIYGQVNSDDYWHQCCEVIEQLPKNVVVNYRGSVTPDEISKYYTQYHLLYLPTTGENFGHAIFESLLNSTPVVISDQTPWRNLVDLGVGWDLSLEDQRAFSAVIDRCADMTFEEYKDLAERSYQYAENYSKNSAALSQYKELFKH
ncbi:MAG: glycosyltransferase family 4 protein [Rikenellaceae bacterium]